MENGFPAGLLLCGADLTPARRLAVPAWRTAVAPLVHRTQIPAAPTSQRRILWRRAISVCIFVATTRHSAPLAHLLTAALRSAARSNERSAPASAGGPSTAAAAAAAESGGCGTWRQGAKRGGGLRCADKSLKRLDAERVTQSVWHRACGTESVTQSINFLSLPCENAPNGYF